MAVNRTDLFNEPIGPGDIPLNLATMADIAAELSRRGDPFMLFTMTGSVLGGDLTSEHLRKTGYYLLDMAQGMDHGNAT